MPSPQEVLDCPMGENDAGAHTVREYLAALVAVLWREDEGFSGKRPFGNSGWVHDLIDAVVTNLSVTPTVANDLIHAAAQELAKKPYVNAEGEQHASAVRRFELHRHNDVTGVSGTGVVAEGVLFDNGQAVVRWKGTYGTVVFHPDGLMSVRAIHLSHGGTEIVWID